MLASLLEENEAQEDSAEKEKAAEHRDDYDLLFEAEDNESYTEELEAEEEGSTGNQENVAEIFGDVTDLLEEEKKEENIQKMSHELRKLQEQMKKLQEQLQSTAIGKPADSNLCKKTSVNKNHTSKATYSLFSQPLKSVVGNRPSMDSNKKIPVTKNSEGKTQDVSLEIYSGLKLR
ncbi:hypothetical protein Chor_010386 [Crotalus horridus]